MGRPPISEFFGDHRWLSNFAAVDVELDGEIYPSVEHAYQAAKTHESELRRQIQEAKTPGEAKKIGSTITVPRSWKERKLRVMDMLLRQKFNKEPFRTKLALTHGRLLIEGNWWGDTFWGVSKGVGENHLGKLIMAIRDGKSTLHAEQASLF